MQTAREPADRHLLTTPNSSAFMHAQVWIALDLDFSDHSVDVIGNGDGVMLLTRDASERWQIDLPQCGLGVLRVPDLALRQQLIESGRRTSQYPSQKLRTFVELPAVNLLPSASAYKRVCSRGSRMRCVRFNLSQFHIANARGAVGPVV